MNKFIKFDSPVMQLLAQIFNYLLITILWILCSLPIITIGISLASAETVAMKLILGEDDTVIKPFFKSFRDNFKQGLILWGVILPFLLVVILSSVFLLSETGKEYSLIWLPTGILLLLVMTVFVHGLPQIARYSNSLVQIIKNSYYFLVMFPIYTITMILLLLMPIFVFLFRPGVILRYGEIPLLLYLGLSLYIKDCIQLKIFEKTEKCLSGSEFDGN